MHRLVRFVLIGSLALLASSMVRAETPDRVVIGEDETLAEVSIGRLEDTKGKGKSFVGEGLLRIADAAPVPVAISKKVNAKKRTSTYKLKTLKGIVPKFKATIVAGGEPETPTKAKVILKTPEGTTRLKGADAIEFLGLDAPPPGGGEEPAGLALDVNGTMEDGLFAVVESVTGASVAFYGPVDDDGGPIRIDSALVTDADGVTTEIVMDALGRPLQIVAENGTVFDWLWYSDRHLRVTSTDPTGELAVAFDVDPVTMDEVEGDDLEFVPPVVAAKPIRASTAKTTSQTLRLGVFRGGARYDPPAPPSWVGGRHVTIGLSGGPDAAYKRSSGTSRIGAGDYAATFRFEGQSRTASAIDYVISKLPDMHSATCGAVTSANPLLVSLVCLRVTAAVAAIPGVQAGSPAVLAACGAAFLAYGTYCSIFKESGAVGTGFDLEEFLLPRLRSVIGSAPSGATVYVQGAVFEWNQFTQSLSRPVRGNLVKGRVQKNGTISLLGRDRLSVNLPLPPPGIILTMSPSRPSVGTTYTAQARFTGIPDGGRARLALRQRGGGDTQAAQVTFAEAGSDGAHVLTLTRTLGAANAHNAYAQIFNASGSQIVIRQIDY